MASVETIDNQSHLVFGDGLPLGHEVVAAIASGSGHNQRLATRYLRQSILELKLSADADDRARLENIDYLYQEESLGTSFWQPHIVSWLSRATNAQLEHFCANNVSRYRQHQTALEAALPELLDFTLQAAKKVCDAGVFPSRALALFETASAAAQYHPIDSFEAGGMLANGYCHLSQARIGLANQFMSPDTFTYITDGLRKTTFHEAGHLAGSMAEGGFCAGLTMSCEAKKQSMHWLEEAFIGHVSQVATSDVPLPEILFPADRLDTTDGSYPAERDFLGIVSKLGRYPFDVALLGEAFIEPVGRGLARREVYRCLSGSLAEIFSDDDDYREAPLEVLSQTYADTERSRRADLIYEWIDRALLAAGIQHDDYTADEKPSDGNPFIIDTEEIIPFDLSKATIKEIYF